MTCIHTKCISLLQETCQGNCIGRQTQAYHALSASVILVLHPRHRLQNCFLAVQYHPAFHFDSFTDMHARSCIYTIQPGWRVSHKCLSVGLCLCITVFTAVSQSIRQNLYHEGQLLCLDDVQLRNASLSNAVLQHSWLAQLCKCRQYLRNKEGIFSMCWGQALRA